MHAVQGTKEVVIAVKNIKSTSEYILYL